MSTPPLEPVAAGPAKVRKASPIRDVALIAIGLIVQRGIAFVTLPALAGALPLAAFGTLEVIVATCELAGLLAGLGIVDAYFRFAGPARSQARRRRVAANALSCALAGALGLLLIGLTAAPMLAALLPGSPSVSALQIAALVVACDALAQLPLAWLRLEGRTGAYFGWSVGRALIHGCGILLAVHVAPQIETVLMAGLAGAAAQGLGLALLQGRSVGLALDRGLLLRLAVYGAPLVFGGLAGFALGGYDRLAVAQMLGEETAGLWAGAAKLALAAGIALQPVAMVWNARRFRLLLEPAGCQTAADGAILVAGFGAAAAAGVSILAPAAIDLLFPPPFTAAAVLVPWLCLAQALKASGDALNLGALMGRSTVAVTVIGIGCGAVLVAGYPLVLPNDGALAGGVVAGAILAASVWGLRLLAILLLAQRRYPLPYSLPRLAAVLVAAAAAIFGLPGLSATDDVAGASALAVIAASAVLAIAASPAQRHWAQLWVRQGADRLRRHRKAASIASGAAKVPAAGGGAV